MAQDIQIHERIAASPEAVFELLADHEQFVALFGGQGRRIREGETEPNGVGSIRRIGPGPIAFEETIVAFDRPHRIDYSITRGSPLRDHLGEIRLQADGRHTVLDYRIRFSGRLPLIGTLVAAALRFAWKQNARKAFARLERNAS